MSSTTNIGAFVKHLDSEQKAQLGLHEWMCSPFLAFWEDYSHLQAFEGFAAAAFEITRDWKEDETAPKGIPLFGIAPNDDDAQIDRTIESYLDYEIRDTLAHSFQEVTAGFPFMYGLLTVYSWDRLEVLVYDLLSGILIHQAALLKLNSRNKRIKLSVEEVLVSDPATKIRRIVEELDRDGSDSVDSTSETKVPSIRFSRLLRSFGLDFDIPDEARQVLNEQYVVRNALVHHNGRVDQNVQKAACNLKVNVGEHLKIDRKLRGLYGSACLAFADHLFVKCTERVDSTFNHLHPRIAPWKWPPLQANQVT